MTLSLIIVSYNTKKFLKKNLLLLKSNFEKYPIDYEIIVIDNNSHDGTKLMLKKLKNNWFNLKTFFLSQNIGFGKANNLGINKATGKYILFLNSDVFIYDLNFNDLISFMELKQEIGALTVRILLNNKTLDMACHRGLPTIWNSFCYFFGLEKIFKNIPLLNRIFGGYHLVFLPFFEIHEVEVISGAFFLTQTRLIKEIGGFDNDYFAYGEDVELCYQIRKRNMKIIYYPVWEVFHLKSISGLKIKKNHQIKMTTKKYFYDAMKIFYQKHYSKKYPFFINSFVNTSIDLLSKIRKI